MQTHLFPSLPISPHLSPSLAGCGGGGEAGTARRGVGGSVAPLVDAHEALLDPHGRRLRRSGELEPPLCPLAPGRDTSASATRPRHVRDTSATRPAGEHRADLRLWAACIRGARTEMGEAWGRYGGDVGEMWGRGRCGGDMEEAWRRYGGDVGEMWLQPPLPPRLSSRLPIGRGGALPWLPAAQNLPHRAAGAALARGDARQHGDGSAARQRGPMAGVGGARETWRTVLTLASPWRPFLNFPGVCRGRRFPHARRADGGVPRRAARVLRAHQAHHRPRPSPVRRARLERRPKAVTV